MRLVQELLDDHIDITRTLQRPQLQSSLPSVQELLIRLVEVAKTDDPGYQVRKPADRCVGFGLSIRSEAPPLIVEVSAVLVVQMS